jgi:maltooligosyltrehalose trehalohydrolase
MAVANQRRRLSAGVETKGDGVTDARVWAPACRTLEVVIDRSGRESVIVPMTLESDGYFSATLTGVRPGDRYWYQLDGSRRRPDPVSRFQPEGPHGPSAIVDPSQFQWTDTSWRGVSAHGQVLYELHIGTFTPEGTWAAAAARLEQLAEIGVTVVEMMPVADFPGRWGWGYDGVNLYAPTHVYGSPDDLRRFVDRAHALGLGVILDVVYNHLGPDGNYLADYSADYFTDKYSNDWGRSLNFEGPKPARSFFAENGAYWIEEFHFDGLRLDATQDVHDASAQHVLAEIVQRARRVAGNRRLFIVAENEPQHSKLVRDPSVGGYGIDALLNDDFHHAALVALTGRREAYYTDYKGSPQELISCLKFGYLYQGQWYSWQNQRRGTPALDLPPTAFVHFLENHDQVANTSLGKRVHQLSSPGRYRSLTALTLLGPATPLLFQGQEFAASTPFLFFVDHRDELREGIRKGRREFLSQFPSLHDAAQEHKLPDPDEPETFERSRLNWTERETHAEALALHRDLLTIRRQDPTIAGAAADRKIDGAVLSPHAFVLRFTGAAGDDRLLFINLGADLDLTPLAEPLLAPPSGRVWVEQWNSDATSYGGPGRKPLQSQPSWWLSAESAVLLRADAEEAPRTHGS